MPVSFNFEDYFTVITESRLLTKDLKKVIPIIQMKFHVTKKALQRVMNAYDLVKETDNFTDIDYYLRYTSWEYIFKSARRLFMGDEGDSFNTFGYSMDFLRNLQSQVFKKDSEFKIYDMIKYTSQDLERMIDSLVRSFYFLEPETEYGKRWEEDKEEYIIKRYLDSEEFNTEEKVYGKTILAFEETIKEFYRSLQALLNGLSEYQKRIYNRTGDRQKPDDLQDVEIAYHASINAKEIYQNGFRKSLEGEAKSKGIGGSNIDNGISFTLDLYHAQGIASVLKTAWLIAHKKYTIRNLMEHLRTFPSRNDSPEEAIQQAISVYQRATSSNVYPPTNEYQLFELYEKALWFMDTYNPVFFGIDRKEFIDNLKNIPYSNIGIIKAHVKTTGSHFEYLESMAEIRIKPEDVVSLDQFIH